MENKNEDFIKKINSYISKQPFKTISFVIIFFVIMQLVTYFLYERNNTDRVILTHVDTELSTSVDNAELQFYGDIIEDSIDNNHSIMKVQEIVYNNSMSSFGKIYTVHYNNDVLIETEGSGCDWEKNDCPGPFFHPDNISIYTFLEREKVNEQYKKDFPEKIIMEVGEELAGSYLSPEKYIFIGKKLNDTELQLEILYHHVN